MIAFTTITLASAAAYTAISYSSTFKYAWKFVRSCGYLISNRLFSKSDIDKINSKLGVVNIKHNNRQFYILFKLPLARRRLVSAIDENDNDITDIIRQYAGVNEDFSGLEITPTDLGFTRIELFTVTTLKVIEQNEVIRISQ